MSAPAEASFLNPRIAGPFLLVALIWGSTWWVITGQIDGVPAAWAVVWRFVIAAPAMAILALATGKSLRIGAKGQRLAMLVGLTQFCGNYMFVYESERHLTSGIVAVMLSLLFVPNMLLGWLWLGQRITRQFALGSLVAIAGIALLFVNEAQTGGIGGNVWLGVALAFGGMIAAAVANVVQANDTGRSLPMASLLAWSMAWGVAIDVVFALVTAGPPVIPSSLGFWAGTAYLALAGSVVTFPLYFGLVRNLGAGRAAYNGVLVVVLAMFLSTVLEGYRWTGLAVAGCMLALAGLVIALWGRK
ncbi:DMT family transporter [Novosphingobium sp. TH158]|uniref:DMT family transporter n=1 Tax=Novosphingobium sp. TH158 TaxID=2067455 RepID=UPI000C7D04F0|nr:DMT family transporter [Novosphingobium sp. TH158]PLK27044.1 EamA family transporter [Novosphingobium sp. TH158]